MSGLLVVPRKLLVPASAACLAAALGSAGVLSAEVLPGRLSILPAAALLCLVTLVLWPWAVLPVGIVGGVAATKALGTSDVTFITVLHIGVLAIGCLALLVRRAASAADDRPRRTAVDQAMALLAVIALAGALFGLARGHALHQVLIATYHLGVIPAYFFVTTHTLTNARRMRAAAVLYVTGAAALAAVELTMPGRHGGLLSVLALVPLLVVAGRTRGWRRVGLGALITLFAADTAVAGYRAMWLAAGVGLLVLLVRGTRRVRLSVALAAIGATTLVVCGAAVSAGLRARILLSGEHLDETAGYRTPEATVGLRVFADWPLTGAGLGQTTRDVYLPTFKITDVGPTYHVFWVMILANLGLVGLIAVLWPLLRPLRAALAVREGVPLAFGALLCGFLAAAAFAGPTDGHWELGLLPALTLLTTRTWTPDPLTTGGRP
ncbi:O-antigen ligase family protein [Streptomyces sp. TG1A-60]|uniref:O-antigen ligase family protein n=1 Tax=Streptomyces sp. TG1A-60 TaxID=3129111 RepID=UPI0030CAEFA9